MSEWPGVIADRKILYFLDMGQLFIGIDIGTSAVKAVIVDTNGNLIADASREHHLVSPKPGWAEENPEEWWHNCVAVIRECIDNAAFRGREIAGVGVTGMVPAIILLDDAGEIIRPSIQQNDARTTVEIDEFRAQIDQELFYSITGSIINQQSVGPKLVWLQRNEPAVWERAQTIFGSYDYINYRLTGIRSIEANWALESGLYDINKKEWSGLLLQKFNVTSSMLPEVHSASQVIGSITGEAASLTGLRPGIPVVAGSADHVAAALAAGIKDEGDLLVKFGSAGDILYCCDSLILDPRLYIDYHDIPRKYLLNGCMATSGSLLKWYVNQFCQNELKTASDSNKSVYEILDAEAADLEPGCDGLVVLPYFLGEKTPIFDAKARGVFFGLTLYHTRAHLYRAVMEGVVYGFKHHVNVLEERNLSVKRVIVSEGGAEAPSGGKLPLMR